MMGIRPRSPGARPAPWSDPQPGGPSPAKRRRLEASAGPESGAAPGLEDAADSSAASVLVSVAFLSEGSTLQLPLDGFNLLLQPVPDSVLQVTLQDHTLLLVSQDLLGSTEQCPGGQSDSPDGLQPSPFLGAPVENDNDTVVEQQEFCVWVPEIAGQEVVLEDDAHPEFLEPYGDPPAGFTAELLLLPTAVPSPDPQGSSPEPWPLGPIITLESSSPGLIFDHDDFHLVRPFPTSPLQPLPPFPSPGPHERPERLPGPHRKARRRLFQE